MTKREKEFWELAYLAALVSGHSDPAQAANNAVASRCERLTPKRWDIKVKDFRAHNLPWHVGYRMLSAEVETLRTAGLIAAIEAVRERTGAGLLEAKNLVELTKAHLGLS